MINIEHLVFDTVYNQLSPLFPEANITAGYDEKIAVFPAVIIREVGNIPYVSGNTDDCAENFVRVTYEIEIESDQQNTARSVCNEILEAVDEIMQGMKFRRIHKNRPLNIDRTIYRVYARYEVIVGKPQEIDGNTVYQMYRR